MIPLIVEAAQSGPHIPGHYPLVGTLTLLFLLVMRDLAQAGQGPVLGRFARALDVGIWPLLAAHLLMVTAFVIQYA